MRGRSQKERSRGRWKGQPRAHTPTQAGEQHPSAGAPGRPSRAPSCPCSPGQARVSATVDAPSKLPEEGPVPRTSASQPQFPRSHHSSRTRRAHLRRQRPPAPPAPAEWPRAVPAAALASCPPPFAPRARHGELAPAAAFPAPGGEGTRWVGHSGAGRELTFPPSGARLDPA